MEAPDDGSIYSGFFRDFSWKYIVFGIIRNKKKVSMVFLRCSFHGSERFWDTPTISILESIPTQPFSANLFRAETDPFLQGAVNACPRNKFLCHTHLHWVLTMMMIFIIIIIIILLSLLLLSLLLFIWFYYYYHHYYYHYYYFFLVYYYYQLSSLWLVSSLKTNMTLEKSPFSIGNTSSKGGFSLVMLVFGRGGGYYWLQ